MAEVYTEEKVQQKQRDGGDGSHGMVELAERDVQHHTTPFPEAYEPAVSPFPRPVIAGLWLSILIGGLLGLVFGALLQNNLLVIPGWEGMYSMSPFTFHAFWTFMGIALGILTGGVASLLVAPAGEHQEEDQD